MWTPRRWSRQGRKGLRSEHTRWHGRYKKSRRHNHALCSSVLVRATKVCCGDKDFHQKKFNSSILTKRLSPSELFRPLSLRPPGFKPGPLRSYPRCFLTFLSLIIWLFLISRRKIESVLSWFEGPSTNGRTEKLYPDHENCIKVSCVTRLVFMAFLHLIKVKQTEKTTKKEKLQHHKSLSKLAYLH